MRKAILLLTLALAGCYVQERSGGTKDISVGQSLSPGESYNPISSLCPQLQKVSPSHEDLFTARELKFLTSISTMNYDYYKYRNPIDGSTQYIGISGEATDLLAKKNIICTDALHKSGNRKGGPTGEIQLKIPGISSEYNEITIGSDIDVVILERETYKSPRLTIFSYGGRKPSQPRAHRRSADIIVNVNKPDSVHHTNWSAASPGEVTEKEVVRDDFPSMWKPQY